VCFVSLRTRLDEERAFGEESLLVHLLATAGEPVANTVPSRRRVVGSWQEAARLALESAPLPFPRHRCTGSSRRLE
jgi:hypothetical protein